MKHPLSFLETMEEPRYESRLFPGIPSPKAQAIVQRPEWQAAIEYRVNQAMHGSDEFAEDKQNNPKAALRSLFPKAPWKFPTYGADINAVVFTAEEAMRIDARVSLLLIDGDAKNEKEAFEQLKEDGFLDPPSHDIIEDQEIYRPALLFFVDLLDKKKWAVAEKMYSTGISYALENFSVKPTTEGFIRVAFMRIFEEKFSQALDMKNILDALHLLRIVASNGVVSIHSVEYKNWIARITTSKPMQDALVIEFVREVPTGAYAPMWRECSDFGFPMDALKKKIKDRCIVELRDRLALKQREQFFSLADKMIRQELFSEKELSENARLRSAIIDYARSLIGQNDQWTDEFIAFRKECAIAEFMDQETLAHYPIIQEKAKEYIEKSFVKGTAPRDYERAVENVVKASILTRTEATSLPSVLKAAEHYLQDQFSDDDYNERLYVGTVKMYVDAGIGTRTHFDNLSGIKRGRNPSNRDS